MSPPQTLPDDAPEYKVCPDCYAEGRDPYLLKVETHFYIKRAPRYKGGYRISAYCKEHESKRVVARKQARMERLAQAERESGETPPELAKIREDERRWHRGRGSMAGAYAALPEEKKVERRAKAKVYAKAWRQEQDPKKHEEALERKRQHYRENREQILAQQRQRRREEGRGPRKVKAPAEPAEDA
ncbi:hypothetical protein EKD04_017510 [Chloroflexales bacterium ZM16-3]|nr:hypothetical protein [Chloroflexales bacterium ZM16-3]